MGNIFRRSLPRVAASAIVLALAFMVGDSHARAAAPTLKWKFTVGQALHYQVEQSTVSQNKVNGQEVKTTVSQTIDVSWTTTAVDAGGTAEMIQTFDRIKSKIETPFGTMDFDSKEAKAPEGPLTAGPVKMLKLLVGAKFKCKMSAQGEISDIRLPDELLKGLKEAGPAAAGMFSEDGLRNMIQETSLVFPAKALDQPWSLQSKIPTPQVGIMVFDKTYKYEGAEGSAEKIGQDIKVSLTPDAKSKFDIKIGAQDGKGTFLFDGQAGHIVSSKVTQKVEMVVSVMNSQFTQHTDTSTVMKLVKVDQAAAK